MQEQIIYTNQNQDISYDLTKTSTYNNYEHEGTSKYDVVNTGTIVEYLKSVTNYLPVHYSQAKTIRNTDGKQVHVIRMRHLDDITNPKPTMPELVLLNSYDTTKAFKLYLGFFRIACCNGIIAGNTLESFSQRHINFDFNALSDFIGQLPDTIRTLEQKRLQWYSRQLTPVERQELALKMLVLRKRDTFYTKNNNNQYLLYDLNRILRVKREADNKNDLWTTFNKVQECMINGVNLYTHKLKRISSPVKNTELNRKLYDIAETYMF